MPVANCEPQMQYIYIYICPLYLKSKVILLCMLVFYKHRDNVNTSVALV